MIERIIPIDPIDWPRCAKCDMPVENFGLSDYGDEIVMRVRCHGKTETVHLPVTVLDDMIGTSIQFGPAFAGIDPGGQGVDHEITLEGEYTQ